MPVDSNLPEPRRRRGRRDNGLDAAAYVEVRDVDPRVGEDLLDHLRDAGVAAFLEPKVNLDPYLRATSLPSPPVDRLYVDRDAQERARAVLEHPDLAAAHLPGAHASGRLDLAGDDVDARFAEIVAGYGTAGAPDTAPETERPTGPVDGTTPGDPLRPTPTDDPADAPGIWRGPTSSASIGPAADDPADHFHPPEPPPWRWPSARALLGLLILAAGALVLFAPHVVGLGGDSAVVLGVGGIAGGVAVLVLRMRANDDQDDDGDDGARV